YDNLLFYFLLEGSHHIKARNSAFMRDLVPLKIKMAIMKKIPNNTTTIIYEVRATQDKGTCDVGRYTGLSEWKNLLLYISDASSCKHIRRSNFERLKIKMRKITWTWVFTDDNLYVRIFMHSFWYRCLVVFILVF
ncbi:hypothetical protein ACJX0J_020144, partial [Zea mays]